MSQHVFKYSPYSVLCGWDRPLQQFFCVIEQDGKEEPVYSNLLDKNPTPTSFAHYAEVLLSFGIPLPKGLLTALELDGLNNAGNSFNEWEYTNDIPIGEFEKALLGDTNTSQWLLEQFEATKKRDPIDALKDAESLVSVLKARLKLACGEECVATLEQLLAHNAIECNREVNQYIKWFDADVIVSKEYTDSECENGGRGTTIIENYFLKNGFDCSKLKPLMGVRKPEDKEAEDLIGPYVKIRQEDLINLPSEGHASFYLTNAGLVVVIGKVGDDYAMKPLNKTAALLVRSGKY